MSATVDDPFFSGIDFEDVALPSSGASLRLPLCYPNSSLFSAQFTAPTATVRSMLPSPRLLPIETTPGRAIVGVTAFDHRRTAVGTYKELGVFFAATYRPAGGGNELPGGYCAFLPVTTSEACVAGIDAWGFPKFVAEIEFREGDEGCRCIVHESGRMIVTLEIGSVSVAPKAEREEIPIFTVKGDELLRMVVISEAHNGRRTDGEGVRLTLGEHPRAGALQALELGGALDQSRASPSKALLPKANQRFPL